MKKFISCALLLVLLINLTSCGDDMTIRNKKVKTYGLLTLDEAKPNVKYRLIAGNVIWSILLFETVVFPIYFVGYSLYEPVGELPTANNHN